MIRLQKLCALGMAALLAVSSFAIGSVPANAQAGRHGGHHGGGNFHGHPHGGAHFGGAHFGGGQFGGHRHFGFRGGRRSYGGNYGFYGGPGYYSGYPGYYEDNNVGAAIAAGVIGMAIGAIASGAAHHGGSVGYCERRFRSYNPNTGMYLGYDGRHHPCP